MRTCIVLLLLTFGVNSHAEVIDLRAERWKRTSVESTGRGVVQYTGDDTRFGPFSDLIEKRIRQIPGLAESTRIEIKTADVRLSLPNVVVDANRIHAVQAAVPPGAAYVPGLAALLSTFSKDKTASAVFCVAINGKNFMGNEARLFRFGADGELNTAVEAALTMLKEAVQSDTPTESLACEPGWEGGQARP